MDKITLQLECVNDALQRLKEMIGEHNGDIENSHVAREKPVIDNRPWFTVHEDEPWLEQH